MFNLSIRVISTNIVRFQRSYTLFTSGSSTENWKTMKTSFENNSLKQEKIKCVLTKEAIFTFASDDNE